MTFNTPPCHCLRSSALRRAAERRRSSAPGRCRAAPTPAHRARPPARGRSRKPRHDWTASTISTRWCSAPMRSWWADRCRNPSWWRSADSHPATILPEFVDECRHAYGVGGTIRHPIHLPSDLVWERSDGSVATVDELQSVDGSIGDIGPRTGLRFADILRGAGSIVWTGSLGKVEDVRLAEGTLALGRALTGSRARIVLGGDALAADPGSAPAAP